MGGGDGGGYKDFTTAPVAATTQEPKPEQPKNLEENLAKTILVFPIAPSGYFGESSDTKVRRIYSDDPKATSEEFFALLGANGELSPMTNGKGHNLTMQDESFVQLRPNSKSRGPAIDIVANSAKIQDQKIHFVKRK